MNRRDFLRQSSLLAAVGCLSRVGLFGQTATTTPAGAGATKAPATGGAGFGEFRELRRGVGTFSGRGGTIGWLSSKDALAVVDTQFPDSAAIFLAGMPGRGGRTIDVVLNTHHHADHTSGNPVFRPVAKTIVAQANVPKLQFEAAKRAEQAKSASATAADQLVFADTTFPDVWRHEFPDEVIRAQFHGPAHTSGDAVVMLEKANVVHMGDLVFNRMHPVIDRPSGASVRGWIVVLEDAVKTYPADAIYIFGHGSPKFGVTGKRDDLLVMRDYWSAVLGLVEKQIASGTTREAVVALKSVPGFTTLDPSSRLGSNLAAAFDELTTKA